MLELLLALLATALGTEVRADSDFLALGGTSLSAVTIAEAVRREHPDCEGVEVVALQAIFEAPTVEAAADMVAAYMRG